MSWKPNNNNETPTVKWSLIKNNTILKAEFINFPENHIINFKETSYIAFNIKLLDDYTGLFKNNFYILEVPIKSWEIAWNLLPIEQKQLSEIKNNMEISIKRTGKKSLLILKIKPTK